MTEDCTSDVFLPINPVDAGAFVVSAKQEEVFRIFDLVRQEQADRLERILSAINVVPQKQVVGRRWWTAVREEPQQVAELPMNVSTNLQRSFELEKHRLRHEDLTGLNAKTANFRLRELNVLEHKLHAVS